MQSTDQDQPFEGRDVYFSEDFFTELAHISAESKFFYLSLWCFADDDGTVAQSPSEYAAQHPGLSGFEAAVSARELLDAGLVAQQGQGLRIVHWPASNLVSITGDAD